VKNCIVSSARRESQIEAFSCRARASWWCPHTAGIQVLTGRTWISALHKSRPFDVGLPTLRLEPRQIRKEATVLHSECGGPLPYLGLRFLG